MTDFMYRRSPHGNTKYTLYTGGWVSTDKQMRFLQTVKLITIKKRSCQIILPVQQLLLLLYIILYHIHKYVCITIIVLA